MQHAVPAQAQARARTCPGPTLADLTADQRAAVEHGGGPLMVLAGPGAGKTRTIAYRIAHLLAAGHAQADQILAVTFTVAAAAEMRERVAAMFGTPATRGLTVATFHSVAARMLRTHAALYGRGADYSIYDEHDRAAVLDELLRRRARTPAVARAAGAPAPGDLSAGEVGAAISLAKNALWTPEHYRSHSGHRRAQLIADCWDELEAELRAVNAFDFDDLLVHAVRLLGEHAALRTHYRRRWPWLLVDEFQDTNFAQLAIVSLLAGPAGNVAVVCDDDQLIFTWRGARIDNVLRFGDWFTGFRALTLRDNFRSRAEILTAAVRCVRCNSRRVDKRLVAARGSGGRIDTLRFANEHHEAAALTNLIADAIGAGTAAAEILVVARSAHLTGALQYALTANGIRYRVLGALGLFERAAVRDALAYLRLLANPRDGQAFRRAVAAPRRGVGEATAARVVEHARRRHRGDLIAACRDAPEIEGIRSHAAREALVELGRGLGKVRDDLRAGRPIGRVVLAALTSPGGLVEHHQRVARRSAGGDRGPEGERALDDLRAVCSAAIAYGRSAAEPTLHGFLEAACGLDGAAESVPDSGLTISTIHRSKGLEAALVILVGCEERLLPSWRSLEAQPPGDPPSGGLEEERRLFYVAVSRAKDRLVITRTRRRGERDSDGPSRFLAEAGLA